MCHFCNGDIHDIHLQTCKLTRGEKSDTFTYEIPVGGLGSSSPRITFFCEINMQIKHSGAL